MKDIKKFIQADNLPKFVIWQGLVIIWTKTMKTEHIQTKDKKT